MAPSASSSALSSKLPLCRADSNCSSFSSSTRSSSSNAALVKTSLGGEQKIGPSKYELTSRGGRGREVMKRGTLVEVVREAPPAPDPLEAN